jgi:radical SAM protein with 4Fe4S-binding SPASM domain
MIELNLAGLLTRVIPPRGASSNRPLAALALIHGYGVPGDDLVYLAEQLKVPAGTALAFPEGPLALGEDLGDARGWWPIDEATLRRGMFTGQTKLISQAADGDRESVRLTLSAWMSALLREFSLHPEQVIIGGFSQGANAALDFLLYDDRPWAGLVFLSGTRLNGDELASRLPARAPMRAFVSHGRYDPVLPLCLTEQLCREFESARWAVELTVFDGGHGIPSEVVRAVSDATERYLGSILRDSQKRPPEAPIEKLLPMLLKPQLQFVEIELTTACVCRCVTCGSNCGRAAEQELTAKELTDVIDGVHALGCKQLTLLGGEPLCHPELLALVRHARSHKLLVEIVTSGVGLDESYVERLKAAGVTSVTVSVDGLETSHDLQRGIKGCYRQVLEAIGILRQHRIPVGVNTQVNRASLPELEALGDELLEAGAIGWQLQTTLPMGRAKGSPLILYPQDMPEVLATVRRLSKLQKLAPHLTDAIGWWTHDDTQLRSTRGGIARCWLGCFAGLQHMGITSQGHVKGCLALTDAFIEGNVRRESLSDIWNDPKRFAYNRAYRPESLTGSCANCKQASLCRGGCTASAVAFHGQPGQNANCFYLLERE